MNVFNRIVMVLGILALIALVAVVMITPMDAARLVQGYAGLFYDNILNANSWFYWYFVGGAGVALFLLLVLFVLELRRPRRKAVRIQTKDGGRAQLDITSVAQSLEYRIDELAGVRKVNPRITSRGRDVDVAVDLDTSPSVNIPVLTNQIIDLCHDIIEGQLGIKIHGPVQVHIRHEPYPRGTMPTTGKLGEEPVTLPPTMVRPASAAASASTGGSTASRPVRREPVEARPVAEEPKTMPAGRVLVTDAPPESAVFKPVEPGPSTAEDEPKAEAGNKEKTASDW